MIDRKLAVKVVNNEIVEVEHSTTTSIDIDDIVYDFPNGYILPAMVDSHAHIIGLGIKLNTIPLEEATSKLEVFELINRIEPQNGWITGRGWNEENWEEKQVAKEDLDKISKDIPIFLIRVDGHAAWVNSKALEVCNINQETEDPMGGKIQKDVEGNPNGLLIDNAIELVRNHIPKPNKELIKKYIIDACNECLRVGITEVHDMDVHLEHLEAFKELDKEGKLPIRLIQFIRGFDGEYEQQQPKPFIGNKLQIVGLKFYADGALGSRGALMIDKYADADTFGLELISIKELLDRAEKGCQNGWNIAVHAIGDKANRNVLDVYEELRKKGYENSLRIEHSQLISPSDILRFQELDVIASVQPIHCTSDKRMAIKRLGANYQYFYPWKTLHQIGVNLIAGSDFPIESHNPFYGIDAFINRKGNGENLTWDEKETMSIREALDCYTLLPHTTTGKADKYGAIEKGKKADFIIVDNPLTNKSELKFTNVLATICDGKVKIY